MDGWGETIHLNARECVWRLLDYQKEGEALLFGQKYFKNIACWEQNNHVKRLQTTKCFMLCIDVWRAFIIYLFIHSFIPLWSP